MDAQLVGVEVKVAGDQRFRFEVIDPGLALLFLALADVGDWVAERPAPALQDAPGAVVLDVGVVAFGADDRLHPHQEVADRTDLGAGALDVAIAFDRLLDILELGREKLATIADDAPLIGAAKLLTAGTDLVIVCNSKGALQGVVTKTDVVRQISVCQGATCMCPASTVMTCDVVLCRVADRLQDVAKQMKERHLKNIPVVDADTRPIGVLTARAVLRVLLSDAEYEETQLVDYVKGVGYR